MQDSSLHLYSSWAAVFVLDCILRWLRVSRLAWRSRLNISKLRSSLSVISRWPHIWSNLFQPFLLKEDLKCKIYIKTFIKRPYILCSRALRRSRNGHLRCVRVHFSLESIKSMLDYLQLKEENFSKFTWKMLLILKIFTNLLSPNVLDGGWIECGQKSFLLIYPRLDAFRVVLQTNKRQLIVQLWLSQFEHVIQFIVATI